MEVARYGLYLSGRRDYIGEVWREWMDSKDGKGGQGGQFDAVISHLTLLASPVVGAAAAAATGGKAADPALPYLGLVAVCVSDTAGAVVGGAYGRTPLPFNGGSRRTVEGSAAVFAATLACLAACRAGAPTANDLVGSAVLAGIEAGTSQIDNVVLPLVCACFWQ